MSDKRDKMEGTIVSEEEAAKGLGFKDIFELRRWDTERWFWNYRKSVY